MRGGGYRKKVERGDEEGNVVEGYGDERCGERRGEEGKGGRGRAQVGSGRVRRMNERGGRRRKGKRTGREKYCNVPLIYLFLSPPPSLYLLSLNKLLIKNKGTFL